MKFIQGKVITRDNEFIAFGNNKKEVKIILVNLWERHIKTNPELLTRQEFQDKISYNYFSTGKGYIKDNINTTYKLF